MRVRSGSAVRDRDSLFGRLVSLVLGGLVLFAVSKAGAQTCFDYSDSCSKPGWVLPSPHPQCRNALVPITGVQQGNLGLSCSWDGDCHEDGDPSDCCTTVVSSSPQANLEMHTLWHRTFGNVGDSDGNNPPGRGQRWYGFHRQFEFDFNLWRDEIGFSPIESLEWCPNMNLPIGHLSGGWAPGAHPMLDQFGMPANCGVGPNRPYNTTCNTCIAFPQCLFLPGGGPTACPTAPDLTCQTPAGSLPFTAPSLDLFPNVEQVSTVLDHYFHGVMHSAVGFADGGGYVNDVTNPNCSPRDPMFWRLHKALDDVVRAWQDSKAVDVMLVIDRSGSMGGLDSSGIPKLEAALDAVDNFADLLEHTRSDGQQNRIGVVSYSNGATLHMPLTVADANLRNPGGPLDTAINDIQTVGSVGCTAIGAGIQEALKQLCPPTGNCQGFSAEGDNDRKAILFLTDGLENRPPCLNPAGPTPGGPCGTQCFGPQLDYNALEFTQFVGIGFGNSGSLNGDLLTLLAERQGGIYVQNPDTPSDDLKNFFVKAFGQLTDEFLLFDPKGLLAADDPVSEPIEYTSCGNAKLTFDSGWKSDVRPGDLRLIVTAPSGALVLAKDPTVEASVERLWAFSRLRLPYRGESKGTWRSHLIRPHQVYVNGFTPDGFASLEDGITIVRRQIQRLCPDGCKRTLYFEEGRIGSHSAYESALEVELNSALLGSVIRAKDANEFTAKLRGERWDLIVYARMGKDQPEPYDKLLTDVLCKDQRAIVTDTRPSAERHILECAGVQLDGTRNWTVMTGDRRLVDGHIKLVNPGHPIATYGLTSGQSIQATANRGRSGAIVAKTGRGKEQYWFVNVLGKGLTKLSAVRRKLSWRTGDELIATARILPSYNRAGGYDHVDARVEVEYPIRGIGTLLAKERLRDESKVGGELLDRRAATLAQLNIPTKTATFPLFDDGTNGDLHPGNAYWTGKLSGLGQVDGMYRFRFIFDLTAEGCTTRSEAVQSVFVDVGVDPRSSKVDTTESRPLPDGRTHTTVRIRPADRYGNLWGPGRMGTVTCGPMPECDLDREQVTDHGDGSYTFGLVTAPGVAGIRLKAFNSLFDVPVPCEDCPRLASVVVEPASAPEHSSSKGLVRLSGPAPKAAVGRTVVYLTSSNPRVAAVPETITVPAGQESMAFPITVLHAHDGPVQVGVSGSYGGEIRTSTLTVTPLKREAVDYPRQDYPEHYRSPK